MKIVGYCFSLTGSESPDTFVQKLHTNKIHKVVLHFLLFCLHLVRFGNSPYIENKTHRVLFTNTNWIQFNEWIIK